MRYYQRRREYAAKGPPHPLMRFLVAPALVVSTIGVLGTGVAMIAFGRRGMIVGLHKASFVVWAGAFGIHVLVYLRRLPALLRPGTTTGGAACAAGTDRPVAARRRRARGGDVPGRPALGPRLRAGAP